MAGMDSMIERVAKAIEEASNDVSLAFTATQPSDTPTIEQCRVADTNKRLRQARAAIEAMQPTPAMVEAACLALHSDNYRKAGDKYREPMFRDMTEALHAAFTAALSDKDGS